MPASIERCNNIIDSDLSVEEVEHAIHLLKSGRSGGFDGLSQEHLKFSGPVFRNWLCQIYNQICLLEKIPKCFKHGIIIPAHKGNGRDLLLKKNNRGITLTCVMSKVFEIILKERISPVLDDAGISQVTQTAYRKGVGYQDSIFAGKESTDSFIQEETTSLPVSTTLPVPLTPLSSAYFLRNSFELEYKVNVGDSYITGIWA